MPARKVYGLLERPGGEPVIGARVEVQLVANVETLRGSGFDVEERKVVVSRETTETDATGRWTLDLEPNSELLPGGTVYLALEYDPDRTGVWESTFFVVPDAPPPDPAGHWIGDLLTEPPATLPSSALEEHRVEVEPHPMAGYLKAADLVDYVLEADLATTLGGYVSAADFAAHLHDERYARLVAANVFSAGPNRFESGGPGFSAQIVRAVPAQAVALQEWQDSAGTPRAWVHANGQIQARDSFLAYDQAGGTGFTQMYNAASDGYSFDLDLYDNAAAFLGGLYFEDATREWQLWDPVSSANAYTFGLPDDGPGARFDRKLTVSPPSPAIVGIVAKGQAAQTANLQEWQDSAGAVLAAINAAGRLILSDVNLYRSGVGVLRTDTSFTIGGVLSMGAGGSGRANIGVGSAAQIPLTLRGATGQTANVQQWENAAGTVLAQVGASGGVTASFVQTTSALAQLAGENSGGTLRLQRLNAAAANPPANMGKIYFRDGTAAGTLKLVVRAGATGAETTILDNIPT